MFVKMVETTKAYLEGSKKEADGGQQELCAYAEALLKMAKKDTPIRMRVRVCMVQEFEAWENKVPFPSMDGDLPKMKAYFERGQKRRMEVLSRLPTEILQTIEDIEVFSLGYMTSNTKKLLKKFLKEEKE